MRTSDFFVGSIDYTRIGIYFYSLKIFTLKVFTHVALFGVRYFYSICSSCMR